MPHKNADPKTAEDLGGVPPGTVMTAEFARLLARDV